MRQTRIYQSAEWAIDSMGNGHCYLLTNETSGSDVFFQGDDATQFNAEFEEIGDANPHRSYDDICRELFARYNL